MGSIRAFLPSLTALLLVAACSDLPTSSLPPSADLDVDGPTQENSVECGSETDPCLLPPVGNDPGDSDPGCDPYLTLNGCECEESEPGSPEVVGAEGCYNPGGTDPGTGGGTPPPGGDDPPPLCPDWDPDCSENPPPPPADTCNTADSVIEDPSIQAAFDTVWNQSNFGAPMADRREQGGWIFSDGSGGFRFEPFPAAWTRGPCSIDVPPGAMPPANAVGWVHTHPYTRGERLTECDWQPTPIGKFPVDYNGLTSEDDDNLQARWRAATPAGASFTGYMIDADQITKFTGEGTLDTEQKFPRCGY
jgi:hypothetical protein